MFYSQLLLSKKGALGIIWMAAHCHKRLKKDQVQQTNISSTVDKILDDEVSVVTHRILAFLLLGIVRIYSKKVEYLFNDCHEVLNRLRSFKTQKNARAGVSDTDTQRHYHSITLPENFELDTFDLGLGLGQGTMGGKVRSHKQRALADLRRKGSGRSGSFCKDSIRISEAHSSAQTPPRDVFEAHHTDQDLLVKPSGHANIFLAGVEVLRRSCRSLENSVDPIQLDESKTDQMHNHLANKDGRNCQTNEACSGSDSDSAVGLSNNRHHSLPSSGLELMVLDEPEKEQLNNRASHDSLTPNFRGRIQEEQMRNIDLRANIEGPTNNMESTFVVSLSNNAILPLPSLEMLRGNMFILEDRLEPMVLDEAEKEQLYDRPSNRNTPSNFLWPIEDVELNSVVNQSHGGSNPVENLELDILHESNFSVEHLSSFKLLNSAEERDGQDKPTHEEHGAEEMHMDHLSTQLSLQEGADRIFTEAVDNAMQVGPELVVIPPESVKCQKLETAHVEHGAEEVNMDHLSTQLSFQEGVDRVFTEAVDNARQVGPELEVIPPESAPENAHVEHGAEEMHMDHQSLSFQDSVDQVFTKAVDKARQVGPELEVIPPESVRCQKPENARVPYLNPHSKLPADVGPMEVAAVQTPGRKERAKILEKRKALLDVAIVVPNKIFKSWIEEDPADLRRGRKEVPHTRLQAWRAHKLIHAPHSFLEPSIPGVSVNLCYYGCWASYAPETISAKPSVDQDGLRAPTTHGAQEQILDIRSPIIEESPRQTPAVTSPVAEKPSGQTQAVRSPAEENLPDQIPIAPGTPVAYLNTLRSHEAETVADSDILEPSSSLESIERRTSSNEQLGWDALFQEKTSSYEGHSFENGNSFEKDGFTARSRLTGNLLGKKFLQKKIRKEEEVLSLSRLLAGKTKKESAIMFYEILVLKTRDCIDVQQETSYRDILVRETPKLRQYLK